MTTTAKLSQAQKLLDKANEIDADRRKSNHLRAEQKADMAREAKLYRVEAQKLIESTF